MTLFFPCLAVLSFECRFPSGIDHSHMTQDLSKTDGFVIVDRVTCHRSAISMMDNRLIEKHRQLILRIIPSPRRTDIRFFLIDDICRTDDIRYFGFGIIEQGVTCQHKLIVHQFHFLTEDGILRFRPVVPTHGSECIQGIFHLSAGEIIRHSFGPVIIETIRSEDGGVFVHAAMNKFDVSAQSGQLGIPVIIEFIAESL